jgi:alpha-mannosidase
MDIAESGYGVALMTDCKHGYDVTDNVPRLTCLRGTSSPDATADMGHHEFTYALLPHEGSFRDAGVIQKAAELNVPLTVHVPRNRGSKAVLPSTFSFVCCSNPAIIVDTIKPSEDDNATILRLYEAYGSHATGVLQLGADIESAVLTNLLEDPDEDNSDCINVTGNTIRLSMRPFEVITIKLKVASPL